MFQQTKKAIFHLSDYEISVEIDDLSAVGPYLQIRENSESVEEASGVLLEPQLAIRLAVAILQAADEFMTKESA